MSEENQVKVCPECNNECDNDALFCNKCGYKFEEEQTTQNLTCPNCGKEYKADDGFCKYCGQKLKEDNFVKSLICPRCGTKYNENDTFCSECGTKLPALNVKSETTEKIAQFSTSSNGTINGVTYKTQSNIANQDKVQCPYCKHEIDRYVKKCPHCGEWLSGVSHFGCGSFMMLITTILGVLFLMFGNDIDLPIFGAVGGGVLMLCCFLYFLPSLISDWRGHDSKFAIFIVNLLFGWTFIGWLIALIFAFTGRSR